MSSAVLSRVWLTFTDLSTWKFWLTRRSEVVSYQLLPTRRIDATNDASETDDRINEVNYANGQRREKNAMYRRCVGFYGSVLNLIVSSLIFLLVGGVGAGLILTRAPSIGRSNSRWTSYQMFTNV